MQRIGELAAFGTAVCWTLSAVFFERGLRHISVLAVNFIKVTIAFLLLTLSAAILRGMPIPFDAPVRTWIFLPLSGIAGFVVTDMFLLSAYGTIGPRITMLFLALSPPMTAGMAYIFLEETIGPRGLLGMVIVIIGICVTIFGKQKGLGVFKIKKEDRKG